MGETGQVLRRRKLAPQVSSYDIHAIYMEHCLLLTSTCPFLIAEATLILSLKKTHSTPLKISSCVFSI